MRHRPFVGHRPAAGGYVRLAVGQLVPRDYWGESATTVPDLTETDSPLLHAVARVESAFYTAGGWISAISDPDVHLEQLRAVGNLLVADLGVLGRHPALLAQRWRFAKRVPGIPRALQHWRRESGAGGDAGRATPQALLGYLGAACCSWCCPGPPDWLRRPW